jgi:GH35 family endo-1,4-beta-xylanase
MKSKIMLNGFHSWEGIKGWVILLLLVIGCLIEPSTIVADDGEMIEEKILAEADANIEKYRKSDAVIEVVDKDGNPAKDVIIKINQTSSDFLFSANVTIITGELGGTIPIEHYEYKPRFTTQEQEDEFKKKFADLFNCATVPLYWRSVEPEAGKPDYSSADRILEWCKSQDIKVKGHTLVWVHGDNVPQWFRELPPEEQRKSLEKHVRDIVSRFKGKIDMWDVVNEAAWANSTLAGMSMSEYTSLPFVWAKESDSNALMAINEAHAITPNDKMDHFLQILTDFEKNNIPYDVIGIQAHINRTDRFRLDTFIEMLGKYKHFNKPIHITEFTPCSDELPIDNSWKQGKWTEEEQADYSVKFYKMCFSIPEVESIGWWDVTDYSSWQPKGGMLREDLSPKPVYNALKDLIHKQWRTNVEGKTDKNGIYKFRGFHGKYDVVVQDSDGKTTKLEIHIKKDTHNQIHLIIE